MERFKIVILTIGLSVAPGLSFAAQISAKDKLEVIDNFDNGLVTNVSENKQSKASSPNVRNFYIDKKIGSLVKGNGTTILGSTVSIGAPGLTDIRQGITYYLTDGSKKFLVSDSSIVLVTTDFRNYTLVVGGLNKNYAVRMKQIEGNIWITNGFDTVTVYTSTGGVFRLPFVPKGRDIEYGPEARVWMYSTPDDVSALYFSANTSTDGIVLAPTDPRAWNANNLMYVGKGDGDQGTFIKNLGGTLIAGKESSVYRVDGKTPTDYEPILVSKNGGIVSAESVVEVDGYINGQGRDGFYEINASNVRRITDHIRPNVNDIRTDSLNVGVVNWDSQLEFSRGAFSGTTVTALGFVQIMSDQEVRKTTTTAKITNSGTTSKRYKRFVTVPVPAVASAGYTLTAAQFNFCYDGSQPTLSLHIENFASASTQTYNFTLGNGNLPKPCNGGDPNINSNLYTHTITKGAGNYEPSLTFSASDIASGRVALEIEIVGSGSDNSYLMSVNGSTPEITAVFTPPTTGQFISDISTISTIVAWDLFEAVANTNGGGINYFYKAATSSVNIATYPWTLITAGSVINTPVSNNYIQWAATMTALSTTNPTNLDSVSINYLQGVAANTRSFGTKWDGRWWLWVSTESTGNYPLGYVKTKASNSFKDAFTQFDGIPIRCFWKDREDVLYGGGSTWAVVMRLDYGTNYNSAPIDAFYEIPALPLGRAFFEKTFSAWMIDVDKESQAHLLLGISIDGGSFVEQSISIDGTGRLIRSIPQNSVNSQKNFGNTFKLRVRNNELDKNISINALGLLYQDTGIVPLPQ